MAQWKNDERHGEVRRKSGDVCSVFAFPYNPSGQIIATSHDLTPKCSLVREIGKSRLVKYYNLARIHGTCLFTPHVILDFHGKRVGKYTIPMDAMGFLVLVNKWRLEMFWLFCHSKIWGR